MNNHQIIAHKDIILELLYGDEDYFEEFVAALIASFKEFQANYTASMQKKDLKALRNAGHKIKPAALMMKLDKLLEMYEDSKQHLGSGHPEKISSITQNMNSYCDRLLSELQKMLQES